MRPSSAKARPRSALTTPSGGRPPRSPDASSPCTWEARRTAGASRAQASRSSADSAGREPAQVAQPSDPRLDRVEQLAVGVAERSHAFALEFGGDRVEVDAGLLGLAKGCLGRGVGRMEGAGGAAVVG